MNESTLTQLKIVVERAVRPIRASMSRKRKMREELMAHVSAVFEEEAARLDNEQAATSSALPPGIFALKPPTFQILKPPTFQIRNGPVPVPLG
jgi:hypothetical protein